MGNCFGPFNSRPEERNSLSSARRDQDWHIIHTDRVKGIHVTLKVGKVWKERDMSVVNCTDYCIRNSHSRLVYKAGTQEMEKEFQRVRNTLCPLKAGQVFETGCGRLKHQRFLHVCVPLWRGGQQNELVALATGFKALFSLVEELHIQSLALTAESFVSDFGYPRDLFAATFMREFESFYTQDTRYLKFLTIIDEDVLTLNIFRDQKIQSYCEL